MPWLLIADDGIEDGQEFAHHGGQGQFGWFTQGNESAIEGAQCGITTGGGQGGHVQTGPHRSPAPVDVSFPPPAAVISSSITPSQNT